VRGHLERATILGPGRSVQHPLACDEVLGTIGLGDPPSSRRPIGVRPEGGADGPAGTSADAADRAEVRSVSASLGLMVSFYDWPTERTRPSRPAPNPTLPAAQDLVSR
jgi:hypothetical protein